MSYEEDDRSHLHGYDAKCYALLADPRQMAVPFPQKPIISESTIVSERENRIGVRFRLVSGWTS